MKGHLGTRIRNYFLTGVLVTAPIGLTVFLVLWIINKVDIIVTGWLPFDYNPQSYLPFYVPGIGLVIVFIGITIVGALAAGIFGRMFINFSESILHRMPVVRGIYSALKQIFETVFNHSSKAFRQVVLFEYPRKGIWAMGFITCTTEGEVQRETEKEVANVFVPTTPNPTSGFLLFIPKKDLTFMEMSVEEGIKMIVSGGIVTPPDPKDKKSTRKNNSRKRAIKKPTNKKSVVSKKIEK